MSDDPELRDVFAMVALHALLTAPDTHLESLNYNPIDTAKGYAKSAYALADFMLTERDKP